MTKQKPGEIVHWIPGGYYGNDPGAIPSDPTWGNVGVSVERIEPALRWLRRRATIDRTFVSDDPNPCIIIAYHLKPRRAKLKKEAADVAAEAQNTAA